MVGMVGGRCLGRLLRTSRPPDLRVWASLSSQAFYSRLRNVGIMAHVDAGKTTTSEQMLYHCKYIPRWVVSEH